MYSLDLNGVRLALTLVAEEDSSFMCGNVLFDTGHPLCALVIVDDGLKCSDNVELSFFSTKKIWKDEEGVAGSCCGNCGMFDVDLDFDPYAAVDNPIIAELKTIFKTIAPQCFECHADRFERVKGKRISAEATERASKSKKRATAKAIQSANTSLTVSSTAQGASTTMDSIIIGAVATN